MAGVQLLTNPSFESWAATSELLTDGGFEAWDDANTPTNWAPSSDGTSSVNQDQAEEYAGDNCVRLDIDASNSAASIAQSVVAEEGVRYRFSVRFKAGAAGTGKVTVQTDSGDYLQDDLTWDAAANSIEIANAASWTETAFEFHGQSEESIVYTLANDAATSDSIYFDAASLKAVPTNCDGWTEAVSGSSKIYKDVDEQDTGSACLRMDVDGSNTAATIAQAFAATVARKYRFKVRHKETDSATAKLTVQTASGDYLQDDFSWGAAANDISISTSDTYADKEIQFTGQTSENITITLANDAATSKSIYLDSCSLYELTERGWRAKPAWPKLNSHPINRGLVGCWVAHEGAGETLHDLTAKKNDGGFYSVGGGNPSWTTTPHGNALYMPDQGRVSIAAKDEYHADVISIEALVRFDGLPSVAGRDHRIWGQDLSASPFLSWSFQALSTTDKIAFTVVDNEGTPFVTDSDAAIIVGVWYHVVGIVDGSGNTKLYINALEQADTTAPGSVHSANADWLRVSHNDTDYHMNGAAAKLAIWDRALSHNEISMLYSDPFVGCRAEWDMFVLGALSE